MSQFQVFPCLKEARKDLVDVKIFSIPSLIRLNGGVENIVRVRRRFYYLGRARNPASSESMAIVGIGGRKVAVVPRREVVFPSAVL